MAEWLCIRLLSGNDKGSIPFTGTNFMKKVLLFLFIAIGSCLGQTKPSDAVLDNPVPLCQNGKPYQTGKTAFLVGTCPFDKPEDDRLFPPTDSSAFWHFRGIYRDLEGHKQFDWNAPALRPNKKSWAIFIISNGSLWIAYGLADHKKESCHSECPAIAAVNGLDFLMFKAFSPSMSWEAAASGDVHYIRTRF